MKFMLMYLVSWLIVTGSLTLMYYIAARIIRCEVPLKSLFFVAAVSALFLIIPVIGLILGLFMTIYLLIRWGNMDFYPEALLIAVIGSILSGVLLWGLMKIMAMVIQAVKPAMIFIY